MKRYLLVLIALLVLTAAQSHAALIVDITGISGSGETTWTFSGSDTAGGGGSFEDNANLANNDYWEDLAEFTTASDLELTPSSGSATLTIDGVTRNIDVGYVDDGGVGSDNFGVGIDGSGNFSFSLGDLVSWTGSIVVPIDINAFSPTPATLTTSNYAGTAGTLDLEVNIGGVAATPEPGTLSLLGLALIGAAALRRRSIR